MSLPVRQYMGDFEPTDNYAQGMIALGEGRFVDCISILEAEPAQSSCYGLALGNCSLAYLRVGNAPEAQERARQALEHIERNGCPHPPSHVQFLRNFGEAVCQQGRWSEAVDILHRALALSVSLAEDNCDFDDDLEIQRADTLNSLGNVLLNFRAWQPAVECFEDAREIYRRHGADSTWPLAYALTNLGLVWNVLGEPYLAEAALMEARGIIDSIGDVGQRSRIDIALIQLGSTQITPDQRLPTIRRAAEAAAETGDTPLAFLRFCIGAEIAEKDGAVEEGFRMLGNARSLIPSLEWDDYGGPRLLNVEAGLMEQSAESADEIIRVLVAGAAMWFDRIAQPLPPEDFNTVSSSLHNHFRRLARHLLNQRRIEEALLAFETGRALGYGVEVDSEFIQRVLKRNPFDADSPSVDISLVRDAQATIVEGEVVIVICALPPELVVFIVGQDEVTHFAVPLPEGNEAIDELTQEIKQIPQRLETQEGADAIPAIIHELGRRIAERASEFTICGLYPYSFFHMVPWRALLRANGMDWSRMPFAVGFSLLLRNQEAALSVHESGVVGLGYGASRSGRDFTDEARVFAQHFGASATVQSECTAKMLRDSLASDSLVFLSVHGVVDESEEGGMSPLMFLLSDRAGDTVRIPAEEVVPESVLSPYVILSACYSGAYRMAWGDYPVGGAPFIVRRGARFCLCTRFAVNSEFTVRFFDDMGASLAAGTDIIIAFVKSLANLDNGDDRNLWGNLACLELLRRV
ncbi:MAG: CHAT domain-containing protein [Planctomycetota bacterium]|nr:MAG: CHAT domain-containing protein [Planctomycetota bacterium]REJ88753.1 MAG: CHAT domain-containing protein [Planctomycetota bacterium]REK26594.1 MAG: CHAT domain-containing protein [Planctomycetota bacterium]REK46095.1 MAG: CHAT domain-containing protein [Planctomycetota bacterium]